MFFGSTIRQWLEPVSVMSDIQDFAQLFIPFAIRSAISRLIGVPFLWHLSQLCKLPEVSTPAFFAVKHMASVIIG